MKNIKYVFIASLLSSAVLIYCGGKSNIKNNSKNNWEEGLTKWKAMDDFQEEKNCNELRAKAKVLFPDILEPAQINLGYIESYQYNLTYVIKFSGLIYEHNGKFIRIPVFQGTAGDILSRDLIYYSKKNNLKGPGFEANAFLIKCNKGEMRKKFLDIVKFYSSDMFPNLKRQRFILFPSPLPEEEYVEVYYTFVLNNIPCYIQINMDCKPGDYKTLEDIVPDEDRDKELAIGYQIYINERPPFWGYMPER